MVLSLNCVVVFIFLSPPEMFWFYFNWLDQRQTQILKKKTKIKNNKNGHFCVLDMRKVCAIELARQLNETENISGGKQTNEIN